MTASWLDVGMVEVSKDGAITLREVNAAESTQARGKLVAVNDDEHFFFTPQLRFRNLVSRLNLREEEYHVAYDDVPLDRTSSTSVGAAPAAHGPARVVYRLSGTATFHTLFGLRNFPLDSQTFAIEIMSSWGKEHVRLVRNTAQGARSVISRDTFSLASEYDLSGQVHLVRAPRCGR
jgi:hypothetical protein